MSPQSLPASATATTSTNTITLPPPSSSPRPLFSGVGAMAASRGKEWATAIAESPTRHAIMNRPFTLLRMRTESLLDTITGGTLPSQVLETERKQKEADRQLKCRGCKIHFGDERGLIRHHDLFPAHVNPPEYKRSKPKRRKSRRSHSTSDVLSSSRSSTKVATRHTRAETMINPRTAVADGPLPIEALPEFQDTGVVHRRARPSRPLPLLPTQSSPDHASAVYEEPASLNDFTRTRQAMEAMPGDYTGSKQPNLEAMPDLADYNDYFRTEEHTVESVPFSPNIPQAVESVPCLPSRSQLLVSPPMTSRAKQSIEASPASPDLPKGEQAVDTKIDSSSPDYFSVEKQNQNGTTPGSAPLLPAFDFGSFKLISQETGKSPMTARPVTKSSETTAMEEKNKAAGAAAASTMRAARREEKRKLVRGASESAVNTLSIPFTLQTAARAIIATGRAGPSEPAIVGTSLSSKAQAVYATLSGEEEVKVVTTASPPPSPINNWSSLKSPLDPSPPVKDEKWKGKYFSTATTGTTFSRPEGVSQSPTLSSPLSGVTLPKISRKSTNPFLNETFKSSMPAAVTSSTSERPISLFSSSSPPSPSRLGSLNPFARISDESDHFDDAFDFDDKDDLNDNEENFYDAPKTPGEVNAEFHPSNPFFRREIDNTHDIISYLPRTQSTPMLSTQANLNKSKVQKVHFDIQTALTDKESPRCPSCYRAFVDLQSVLAHVDESNCNPFFFHEGQAINAN